MLWRRIFGKKAGVAAIEAMLGTGLLLFAALSAMQIVLVFQGQLAAYVTAARAARTVAITGMTATGYDVPTGDNPTERIIREQVATTMRGVSLESYDCSITTDGRWGVCSITVKVTNIIPGASLITTVVREGQYPIGGSTDG